MCQLVTVSADLSLLPSDGFRKVRGADDNLYYEINYSIEITYYSGYTTYELIYNNTNYGPVAAEYV